MIQKEVADRVKSPPGSRQYGILSVFLQAWYHIDYLFTVNEGVFFPPPKVKSAVIRLRRNDLTNLGCDEKLFMLTVKKGFNQRRKTLKNSLKEFRFNVDAEQSELLRKRAEQLSIKDFCYLTKMIASPFEEASGS